MNSYAINLQPITDIEDPCFDFSFADITELRSDNWQNAFGKYLNQCETLEECRWLVQVTFGDRDETIGFTCEAWLFRSDDVVQSTLRVLVTGPTYFGGELYSPTMISVEIM